MQTDKIGTANVRPVTIAATTLLVLGILSIATAFLAFGAWDARPVTSPLTAASVAVKTFEVTLSGPYEIAIEIDRLEGQDSPFEGEFRHTSPVGITWRIKQDETEVASGDSRESDWPHFGGGDSEGQIIGSFEGLVDRAYTLEYRVDEFGPEFLAVHPRICVQSDNRLEPFHSRFFAFPALFWLGAVLAVIAILILGWGLLRALISKHPVEHAV